MKSSDVKTLNTVATDVSSPDFDEGMELYSLGEAEIDSLLRLEADTATAAVDFASIKSKALAAHKKKTVKRNRFWRYAVSAAAALLFCFGAAMITNGLFGSHNGDIDIYNSRNPNGETDNATEFPMKGTDTPNDTTPEPFSSSLPDSYKSQVFAGVPNKSTTDNLAELFPAELPDYMNKSVDESKSLTLAQGVDAYGNVQYFDCMILTSAPYGLEVGEAGSFSDGDDFVYYWQISDAKCLRVRFFGFTQSDAQNLFKTLSQKVLD